MKQIAAEGNNKIIMYVVIAFLVVFLGLVIYVAKKMNKPPDEEDQAEKDYKEKDLTLTKTELTQISNRLKAEFDSYWTSDSVVLSIVKQIPTKADWFGLSNIYDVDDKKMRLSERLADQCYASGLQAIVTYLKTINVTI